MKCMVVFCKNKGNIPGMTYFMLTSRRHDSWMRALGRDPTIEHLTDKNCVCHVHFREEDKYVVNNKIRLRPDALPLLSLRKPFLPSYQTFKRKRKSQLDGVTVTSKPEVQAVEHISKNSCQQLDGYLPGHAPISSSQTEDITNNPAQKRNLGGKVVCRMCLEPIVERNKMVPLTLKDIHFPTESETFKQNKLMETFKITNMIQIVMPDFDFKAAYNPIACHKCVAKVESAYKFIEGCRENEIIIQKYKSRYCPNAELVTCEDVAQNKFLVMEHVSPEKKLKTSKEFCSTESVSGSLLEQSGCQLEQRGNTGLLSDISQADRHEIVSTSSSASQESLAIETCLELCGSIKCKTEDTGDYGSYGGDSNSLVKTEELSCIVKEEIVVKDVTCDFTVTPNNQMDMDYPVKDEDCLERDALSMSVIDYF